MTASTAQGRLFLILGRSRTGSNLLIHLLRQHPSILCKGEVFANTVGESWRKVLDDFSRQKTPWVGFKMFYYHARPGASIWSYLENAGDLPVIHMKRRNKLRTAVSRAIAAQTGQWAVRKGDETLDKQPVELNVTQLEAEFRQIARAEERFSARFSHHPYLEIEYEDLARKPLAKYQEVTDLLDLPRVQVSCKLLKQNPEPLAQLIHNYPELKAAFADTEWACYFEPKPHEDQ